jgi:hypothetical protein
MEVSVNKRLIFFLVAGSVILSLALAIVFCRLVNPLSIFSETEYSTPTSLPSPQPTRTPDPRIPTISPILNSIEFPDVNVEYPINWPSDLYYPEEFNLVEAQIGGYLGGASIAYEAKLIFRGNIDTASELLQSFLIGSGWDIPLLEPLDSGGQVIFIEKEDKDSGIISIEHDREKNKIIKVIAIMFR